MLTCPFIIRIGRVHQFLSCSTNSGIDDSSSAHPVTELGVQTLKLWRFGDSDHLAKLVRKPHQVKERRTTARVFDLLNEPCTATNFMDLHCQNTTSGQGTSSCNPSTATRSALRCIPLNDMHTARAHSKLVSDFYGRTLGGIDAIHSSEQKGLNGSIGPSFMLLVFEALLDAVQSDGFEALETPPVMIDFGASEGRALMTWAVFARFIFKIIVIDLFGVELPHYRENLQRIHEAACKHIGGKLDCSLNIDVVWKDCNDMKALKDDFPVLQRRLGVVYSFWTSWLPEDKQKLLALVANHPNIMALAVYVKRNDGHSTTGESFDGNFICKYLENHSAASAGHIWRVSFQKPGCKFIGSGSETATALVLKRTIPVNDDKPSHGFSDVETKRMYVELFIYL